MQFGWKGRKTGRVAAEVAGALELVKLGPMVKEREPKRGDFIEAVLASLTAERVPDAPLAAWMYPI